MLHGNDEIVVLLKVCNLLAFEVVVVKLKKEKGYKKYTIKVDIFTSFISWYGTM